MDPLVHIIRCWDWKGSLKILTYLCKDKLSLRQAQWCNQGPRATWGEELEVRSRDPFTHIFLWQNFKKLPPKHCFHYHIAQIRNLRARTKLVFLMIICPVVALISNSSSSRNSHNNLICKNLLWPDIILYTLHIFTYWMGPTTPWSGYYYYFHFTDE